MRRREKLAHIALRAVLVMVVLLGMASITWAQGYGWTTKADMPTAKSAFSTSVVDGKIYAIGGNGGRKTTVVEYDPTTDIWTEKADMATGRQEFSTSAVDGKIYAFGGAHFASTYRTVEEYDPATDTWTEKADMPTIRALLSTSVVDGKIYAIGGGGGYGSGGPGLSSVEEYDPATDTWTKKAQMPTGRTALSTSVVDGKIYAFGGQIWGTRETFSTVEEYDPATDTWTRKADMLGTRVALSTSAVDGKIYAIGGSRGLWPWGPVPTVEAYYPAVERVREGRVSATETFATWVGQPTPLEVTVELEAPLETTESLRKMMLDLSLLGLSSDLPLVHVGDGRYTLSTTVTPVRNGQYDLPILVETTQGEQYRFLSVPLAVWPTADLVVFDEGLAGGGELSARNIERLNPNQTAVVFAGSAACAVEGKKNSAGWTVGFPFASTGGLGYRTLRFAIHPGETTLADWERFDVAVVPGMALNFLEDNRVNMARREWQVVEIPLGLFETDEPYNGVNFSGNFVGVFFLDAVELVLWPEDAEDLVILGDALSPGWEASGRNVEHLAPTQTDVVHTGSAACAVRGEEGFAAWTVKFQTADPVDHFDYETLRFALHPGDVTPSGSESFFVYVEPGKGVNMRSERVNLLKGDRVNLEKKAWQVVELPLALFEIDKPIESVNFSGNFAGVFYLDDLALEAVRLPSRSPTAVREERIDAIPQAFTLEQNCPNPFNSDTVIRFALPTTEKVELVLFNLAGQQVATLVEGMRQVGTYAVRWDGRNDNGRELASGVYLYRLQVGQQQVETRKLMLMK